MGILVRGGRAWVAGAAALALTSGVPARGDDPPATPPSAPAAAPEKASEKPADKPAERPIVEKLRADAGAVRPLVTTDAARGFLDQAMKLPDPPKLAVWRSTDRKRAYTEAEYAKLPEAERVGLERREPPASFYYLTGFGSPIMYGRALDLYAKAAGIESFKGKTIADFGYGTIGHLWMLASAGANCVGTDVEAVFRAIYAERPSPGPGAGEMELLHGRWPGDEALAARVAAFTTAHGGLDVFLSKNTLKRGYIHPERETNKAFLVDLGVSDERFVTGVFEALKPGGWLVIYNLSPAQNPPDKPYLPHADGRCPFDRALLEKAGFEVVEFDHDDREAALDWWMALGFNGPKTREEQRADLFAWYTLCRKPAEKK
jgi:hypothetical protein